MIKHTGNLIYAYIKESKIIFDALLLKYGADNINRIWINKIIYHFNVFILPAFNLCLSVLHMIHPFRKAIMTVSLS